MAKSSSHGKRERIIATREHASLYEVLDVDPRRAVAEARQLTPTPDLREVNVEAIRAAIFIDAGVQLGDLQVVSEGVELLRRIHVPTVPQFAYNLGNGVAAIAHLTGHHQPGELDTAALRQEARSLFQRAADECDDPSVQSSSLTNLGNLLKDSFRWIEAYDAYAAALEHDPANAIALSGISSLLRWRMKDRVDAEGPLRRAAVRYLLRARTRMDAAYRYAGPNGAQRIEELVREFGLATVDEPPQAEAPPISAYASFVRKHRLALCMTPESAGSETGRWDHLAIKSVSEPMGDEWRVPTVFSAWNVLKADFLTARWLAHSAMNGDVPETGFYSDTLDYANYGSQSGALVLAQKAAVDVLDKIAVAATDYLRLPGSSHQVYFGTRWHLVDKKRQFIQPLQWQPEIQAEIGVGTQSLIALAELAYDYVHGYLRSKKEARNTATHRFVVLHEMLIDGHSRPSEILERHVQADFERILIESLQVARAALMYFSELIAFRERRLAADRTGIATRMLVPSHHWVRGEDRQEPT